MKEKNMQKKDGFTVVEVLLTLSLVGFIMLMTMLNARKQMPDVNKARYKKAYLVIEQTVSNMINDNQMYPSLFLGFKMVDRVVTEFGEVIGDMPENKFREGFMYIVDPVQDGLKCRLADGNDSDDCFMTDDGVVYGIPSTNFSESSAGLMDNYFTIDGTTIEKFAPITVYTDWEKVKDDTGKQEQEAMYVGVQYDGNIRIFYPSACKKGDLHRYCRAEEYLLSDNIKKEGK